MAPIKDFVEKFIQRAAKRRKAIEDGAADSSNPNNPLTVPLSLNSSNLSQTSATPSCRPLFSQLPYGSEKLRKVFDYLKSQCGTDEGKLVQEFADAWFYAVVDSVTECEHRVDMLKFLIELLGEECLERKFSVSVLKSTQHQIRDQLDAQTVIKLCSFYGEDFKNGKSKDNRWLDVVSALVQKLSDFKEVKWQWEGESQTTMTGAEAQKCFLKQLLAESGGCNKSLRHALTVLKDCGCAGNETRAEFVEKLLKQLGESATSKELVATTLQLLALTSKTECATVVEKVCDGFLRLESAYRPATDVVADSAAPGEEGAHRGLMLKQYRELMEGEATALLAALESIRLDVQMARSLFTSVKAKGLRLLASSFSVATMLSLTQVSRFRSLAMHEMKSLATRLCREQKRLDDCNWLKNQLAHQPLPDLKSVLIGLVEFRYSSMDWMMALGDSLIDFGFILLDTHVNKLRIVGGRISDSSADGSNAVAALGKWLVFQCFMSDESACPGILDRLIDSITKRNLKIEAWYSIDLLAMLVSKCPMQVLSCKKRLLDTLSSITVFNSISAIPLLSALMPVIVKSPDLRTKFLDTLKTAMLSHGVDSLKTAVSGFLIFLRNYRTPSGSKPNALVAREDELSQTFPTFSSQLMHDVSQQIRAVLPRESGKSNRGKNYDALCLEAISCLKRCFYQSAETRIGLYKGLVDLVRKNNMLLDPAIDMLLTHLRSFIADTGSKPIITDKIVVSLKDRLIPMEPLVSYSCLIVFLTKNLQLSLWPSLFPCP
uniref:Uncharacterized protein n=1 Tax=Plectus sambesii TaxID=2011161 RepID=A0A914W4G1_9BILA